MIMILRNNRLLKTERVVTMARARAKEQGLTNYYTGIPCGRGHLSPRSVSGGTCLACSRVNRKVARVIDYIPGLDEPMPKHVPHKISRGIFPPEPKASVVDQQSDMKEKTNERIV
jgi:hypothetical protein